MGQLDHMMLTSDHAKLRMQELIATLWTRRAIIWTTVAIMTFRLNTEIPATINLPSPPLPFASSLKFLYSVSFYHSAGWAVRAISWSTVPIMARGLHAKIPEINRTRNFYLNLIKILKLIVIE